MSRRDRGVFRYDDEEWERVQERKTEQGYAEVPFATWLRRGSLGELDTPSVSRGYLTMLERTRERAVTEAKAWREAMRDLGTTPEEAAERLRAILSS